MSDPAGMIASWRGLSVRFCGLAVAVNGLVIVAVQPVAGAWLDRRERDPGEDGPGHPG
jgi:hypothetical protein